MSLEVEHKLIYRGELFRGKVALVSGGGTGIGYACARDLVKLGCDVVIASRKKENLDKAVLSITEEAKQVENVGTISWKFLDLKKSESIFSCVKHVVNKFGRLDYLVNNAGGQFLSSAEDISENGWNSVLRVCLTGTFLMCKAAYTYWMAENGGCIVNITATVNNGFPLMAHSGAARAGVENLSKTLSLEWIVNNVRVNCVAPGIVFTESGIKNYGAAAETILPALTRSIPAGRCGTAEEVAAAVVFLLSPGASYITGVSLSVDGGQALSYMVPLFNSPKKSNLSVYGTLNPLAKL